MKIVADSSCDMITGNPECLTCVPILIYTDKDEFNDDGYINIENMLTTLENHKGRSYTSCPSVDAWIKAFEGDEEVYVVAITSGLSGTYNSAMTASQMYKDIHPDAKIHVFDSRSTGPEMKMGIEKIIELKKQGKSFEEVVEEVERYFESVHLLFVLGSVHNLAENGRISKIIASAVGVLGLSIIGFATKEGTIEQVGKGRGINRIVRSLRKFMDKYGYKGGKLNIDNVLNVPLAKALADSVRADYPNAEIAYYPATGLCSFYAERGGIILGFECE